MDSFDAAALYLLGDLRAPVTTDMRLAVHAWCRIESGGTILGNNPWNLHSWGGLPGQTGYRYAGPGDKNVAIFDSLEHGVLACARRLLNPIYRFLYRYGAVVDAARKSDPEGFLIALARSSWAANRYGTRDGGPNKLLTLYAQLKAAQPTPPEEPKGEPMIVAGGLVLESDHVIDLKSGAVVYERPSGPELKRFATPETVDYMGLADGWQAVLIKTANTFDDRKARPVIAYVRGYAPRPKGV